MYVQVSLEARRGCQIHEGGIAGSLDLIWDFRKEQVLLPVMLSLHPKRSRIGRNKHGANTTIEKLNQLQRPDCS